MFESCKMYLFNYNLIFGFKFQITTEEFFMIKFLKFLMQMKYAYIYMIIKRSD
jgi:hypothetical protein